MYIRNTRISDIDIVMNIYENARKYMRNNGNMLQWSGAYPSEDLIKEDIFSEISYVVVDDSEKIIAVFAFLEGPDITYKKIYDGKWPNDKEYSVIHRIAVDVHGKGIAAFIYNECLKRCSVLRIDTHKDNIPMQNSLKKNGFEYCGIIHLLSGDERLAYQKERENYENT